MRGRECTGSIVRNGFVRFANGDVWVVVVFRVTVVITNLHVACGSSSTSTSTGRCTTSTLQTREDVHGHTVPQAGIARVKISASTKVNIVHSFLMGIDA